jgi:ribose 5-phosphate isomerase B
MRIALGADHGGFDQKESLKAHLESAGHEVCDCGTFDGATSVDYPDFALSVARAVADGEAEFGILVCGTGLGMAIAANKVPGIRAVTITDVNAARLTRQHNNANVLCLSGRFTDPAVNRAIVDVFLSTAFEAGRHQARLDKIAQAERD